MSSFLSQAKFINRTQELQELSNLSKKGGLIVIFGRRRIGKTRLITHWIGQEQALYTQAIESDPKIQLDQVFHDIRGQLKTSLTPKNWAELFEILELQNEKLIFCIDEFPYLVSSDPSVPSVFQKWIDHQKKGNVTLILTGSSFHMMHDIFLSREAPLFGRARKVLHLGPMDYKAFCKSKHLPTHEMDTFIQFSLVGGVPKYWEFLNEEDSIIQSAENLFFNFSPFMENEPQKLLSDEKLSGLSTLSILDSIGRGAQKPSEIARRLEVPQTNLSRPLQRLIDASFIHREIPFGESLKSSKKSLYRISDPALRFWYSTYSPHRVLWKTYTQAEKTLLLKQHASTVFEDYCRSLYPESSRYWEGNLEFDLVRHADRNPSPSKQVIITEVKFRALTSKERQQLLHQLQKKWESSLLSRRYEKAQFEIFDLDSLSTH